MEEIDVNVVKQKLRDLLVKLKEMNEKETTMYVMYNLSLPEIHYLLTLVLSAFHASKIENWFAMIDKISDDYIYKVEKQFAVRTKNS